MLAVHFGAGNIGRGFIGSLLYQSGYETVFVDVNNDIVHELNQKNEYRVVLADESSEELLIKNVSAINSMQDPDRVIEAIAKADLVTTAVGPNILPIIAKLITKGLQKRVELTNQPLNIIACENMIGGSSLIKKTVYEGISEEERSLFDQRFGFPDSAVDRIVPNQQNEDRLLVSVEPFYEWVVDLSKIVGVKPEVEGIHYVDDLTPYIERKLFTVNTGHAVAAYIGYLAGFETIKAAMDDANIRESVHAALTESGKVLIEKYHFDEQEHAAYINKIIKRFLNPYISDEVTRVGRSPLRKLGPNDRLISPAKQYCDLLNESPEFLAKGIAAALQFDDSNDNEAVELQAKIKAEGYEKFLIEFCGIPEGHPLLAIVLAQLEQK